jgi:hypothetical protein
MKLFISIAICISIASCTRPVTTVKTQNVSCTVVKFTVQNAESQDICAVECNWEAGVGNNATGFSNATPVPCSWYGKTITRS